MLPKRSVSSAVGEALNYSTPRKFIVHPAHTRISYFLFASSFRIFVCSRIASVSAGLETCVFSCQPSTSCIHSFTRGASPSINILRYKAIMTFLVSFRVHPNKSCFNSLSFSTSLLHPDNVCSETSNRSEKSFWVLMESRSSTIGSSNPSVSNSLLLRMRKIGDRDLHKAKVRKS